MSVLNEVQNTRNEIILQVDKAIDDLILRLTRSSNVTEERRATNYESEYPITSNPALFKGKKPTTVTIRGERIEARTWKKVIGEVMRHCNRDTEKHVDLMNLRGRIFGRERVLLAKDGEDMRSPLMVGENLYIETHYDTETLLKTVMKRILDVVGYDYSGVMITTRND